MRNIFENGFGLVDGRKARLFTMEEGGLAVSVTDFGASLAGFAVTGRDGVRQNVVLGYGSAKGYALGSSFVGATVGRYAGRIGGAQFRIGGELYTLPKNDGQNHLHGGFSKRFWNAELIPNGVRFTLDSPAGDEGFPGCVCAAAEYELFPGVLRLTYRAVTDAPTHVSLTNHAYFNLAGGGGIGAHTLTVFSDAYAEVGPGLIPSGRFKPVRGSVIDLSRPTPLSRFTEDGRLAATRGLDHSFMLRGEPGTLRPAARLYSPETGLTLDVSTTQPSVHVYTAGFLGSDAAPKTQAFKGFSDHAGVCLETQHLPDSPNKPLFPGTLLLPGAELCEVTEYRLT